MAEIRIITNNENRLIIGEDPYSSFNRLFIDGYAFDLTTLTPSLNKQFNWQTAGNQSTSVFQYGADSSVGQYGTLLPTAMNTTQNQLSLMYLQKQTISCYGPGFGTGFGGTATPTSPIGWCDTFHSTLDFLNYPLSKFQRLSANNCAVLQQPFYNNYNGTGTRYYSQYFGSSIQDITVNGPQQSQVNLSLTRIHWEDSANGYIWGVDVSSTYQPYVRSIYGYAAASQTGYNHTSNNNSQLFFMGVDNANAVYFLETHDWAPGTPYHIYKYTPNTAAASNSYPQIANALPYRANASANTIAWRRNYPSNIRRDSSNVNRYVFYSSHYDNAIAANTVGDVNSNLAPLRFTFDVANGNVYFDQCNVAYPGSNGYANYAQAMANTPGYLDTVYNNNPYMMKPYQWISNGNNYITFWFVDSSAGYYTSSGSSGRWKNSNTRTMITYTMPTGQSDNLLTFHSTYTFNTLFDIPWNYMPINQASTGAYSNSTLMVVPATGKTNFLKWNDANGWSLAATYPVEARGCGIDSTGRLWIQSMEKNSGVLHMLSNTIPVNVSVVLANTGPLTYTGNTISTYALVNAWNYAGDRVASNVTLTINGSTMLIANNSGKTYTLTTSNTVDTAVSLTISGGGLNNMYATISV